MRDILASTPKTRGNETNHTSPRVGPIMHVSSFNRLLVPHGAPLSRRPRALAFVPPFGATNPATGSKVPNALHLPSGRFPATHPGPALQRWNWRPLTAAPPAVLCGNSRWMSIDVCHGNGSFSSMAKTWLNSMPTVWQSGCSTMLNFSRPVVPTNTRLRF